MFSKANNPNPPHTLLNIKLNTINSDFPITQRFYYPKSILLFLQPFFFLPSLLSKQPF